MCRTPLAVLGSGAVSAIAPTLKATEVTDSDGRAVGLGVGVTLVIQEARRAHAAGRKLIFLGVGADAGLASHMAIDFSKNAAVRPLSMTDASAITCIGNDLGFEKIFAKQLEFHGRCGDMAIIIGASGSASVLLNAAHAARELGLRLVTITTSPANNPLRLLG